MHINTFTLLQLLPLAVTALPSIRPRDSVKQVVVPFNKKHATRTAALASRQITSPLEPEQLLYTIDIGVGTPPQNFSLILDTGSSDIWVYAVESKSSCADCTTSYYDPGASSTEQELPDLGVFNITYGTPGSGVSGYYAADNVTIEDVSVKQTIGVVTKANENDPEGGIFGIGFPQGESITDDGGQPFPGYLDTLVNAGIIDVRAYSIYLNAANAQSTSDGAVIFGGTDSSKYTGDLVEFPIVLPSPDGRYRLDVAEPSLTISGGGQSATLPPVSSDFAILLDTGTAISRIPNTQFALIAEAVGAVATSTAPIYAVDCTLANESGGVDFNFAGPNGSVTVQVAWTQLVVEDPTLPSGVCIFGLAPASAADFGGLFILGDTFMRAAYVLFNFDTETIGIAQAVIPT